MNKLKHKMKLQKENTGWHQFSVESPLDCKEIQPVHSKGDQPWVFFGRMMLKWKLHYFGHLMRRVDSLEKTDAGRDWGQEEKGTTEDEMAGWHHWLDGHAFEWTPGVGDGQGDLACCDSWGHKESDMNAQDLGIDKVLQSQSPECDKTSLNSRWFLRASGL